MSYILPHKRHAKGSPSPKPTPALMPAFRKNLNFKSVGEHKRNEKYLFDIRYAHAAVRKWFPVGLTDDSQFSSLVKLEPVSMEQKSDENPLSLVLMHDNLHADSTVTCKCTVVKDQEKIQLQKIENYVRNMVADMSCLGKSLDLRLMLHTKKIMMALSDEEINEIKNLIGSAVLDSEVRGGLRWPFGEDSSGSQYSVIGVCHTTAKSYGNSSIRLRLRHADRFDLRSSTGEVAQEASLKMPGIVSQMGKQTIDENLVLKMLEDNLRLIWGHCLSYGSSS